MRLILILVFVTAISFFWLLYQLLFQSKAQVKYRLQETVGSERHYQTDDSKRKLPKNLSGRIQKNFAETDFYRKSYKLIAKSYVKMRPEELLILSIMVGVFLYLVVWWSQNNVLLAVMGLALGLSLPSYSLRFIGMKHAKKMNKQFPQALSILSNGLRVGFSFPQSLAVVTREMEAPIAYEFEKILHDSQLGKPMDEALSDFGERTDDEDITIFVTTLLIQTQVGGDLAEILDIIAKTIRERIELKGQIRVMTSQSKFSAMIIGVLPIALGSILFLMNPEYMMTLFTEPLGLLMVGAALVMMVLGFIALYKIVDIKV